FSTRHFAENQLNTRKDSFISLTYLHKNGKDEYDQVLQRSIVLETDSNGLPIIALSIVHYVGHILKHGSLNAIITVEDNIDIYSYHDIENNEKPKTFSRQERKLLEMLAKGLDSKTIAKELSISPKTVDNHRRNIIKKTNCIDTTGVVAYAQFIN